MRSSLALTTTFMKPVFVGSLCAQDLAHRQLSMRIGTPWR
jgi:hypothetical protein